MPKLNMQLHFFGHTVLSFIISHLRLFNDTMERLSYFFSMWITTERVLYCSVLQSVWTKFGAKFEDMNYTSSGILFIYICDTKISDKLSPHYKVLCMFHMSVFVSWFAWFCCAQTTYSLPLSTHNISHFHYWADEQAFNQHIKQNTSNTFRVKRSWSCLFFSPTRSVSWNSSCFSRHPHEPLTYTCKRPVMSACFQHAPLSPVVMTTWAYALCHCAAVAVFYCTSHAWIGHSFGSHSDIFAGWLCCMLFGHWV